MSVPISIYGGIEMESISKKKKRITAKNSVRIIVQSEFIGTKSIAEAFTPIIYDDIQKRMVQADTIDKLTA